VEDGLSSIGEFGTVFDDVGYCLQVGPTVLAVSWEVQPEMCHVGAYEGMACNQADER
jgi:hypothetical protein